jgi:hypothetical protein
MFIKHFSFSMKALWIGLVGRLTRFAGNKHLLASEGYGVPSFFPSLGFLRWLQHPSLQMSITGSAKAVQPNYLIPFSLCSQIYIYIWRIKSFHINIERKEFYEETKFILFSY